MTLHISKLIDELGELPEQDSAAMQLLSLLNDPYVEAQDIARIIEADPSMTTRLLTLANSAFFSVRSPATNAWVAVLIVGFNVVRALAATGSLGLNRSNGEMPDGYFEHSVASAAGASVVARQVGGRPADAFRAGLLHDVGSALLFRSAKGRWQEAVVSRGSHHYTSLAAERTIFGAGHDGLGAAVLEYLHFPDSIVDVAREHNQDPETVESELTRVVIAGIALAEQNGVASTTEPIADAARALELVGVPASAADELTDAFQAELNELRTMLR